MKKELLFSITKKDFEIQTFRSGGHGGQKQNKTSSGVRIIHRESGAKGESREERYQHQNKKIAFRRLVNSEKFQSWLKIKTAIAIEGFDRVQGAVDEAMQPQNLKIEGRENKKWVEIPL